MKKDSIIAVTENTCSCLVLSTMCLLAYCLVIHSIGGIAKVGIIAAGTTAMLGGVLSIAAWLFRWAISAYSCLKVNGFGSTKSTGVLLKGAQMMAALAILASIGIIPRAFGAAVMLLGLGLVTLPGFGEYEGVTPDE